jgi:hypothetical protein
VSDAPVDERIELTDNGLVIHGYYPWAKRVPYDRIRGVELFQMSNLRGRGRIWGTANPRYWANLDPGRVHKSVALILDVGKRVHPFITPDDPDAVVAAIRAHTGIEPTTRESGSPFI